MCVMAPIFQPFVDESVTNTGVYIGDTTITLSDTNEQVNCQHWRFMYDSQEVEACLIPPIGTGDVDRYSKVGKSGLKQIPVFYRPVLVQHPAIRLEVFHFEPIGSSIGDLDNVSSQQSSSASKDMPNIAAVQQTSSPEVAYLESTLNKLSKERLKKQNVTSSLAAPKGTPASVVNLKGLPSHWPKIFDASKASKARCTAWG